MKKNLLVMLVVGLMVALLGAPAFATDGHDDGHDAVPPLEPEEVIELFDSSDVISADQIELSEGIADVLSDDALEDLADFEAKSADYAEQIAEIFEDAGVRPGSLAVGGFNVSSVDAGSSIDVTVSGDYDRLLLLVSTDSDGLHWVEVDADGTLKAAAAAKTIKGVTDNNPGTGDLDPASGEIKLVTGGTEDEVAISTGSSSGGGGCDLLAIAPMAGLLVLPLMLLVKR